MVPDKCGPHASVAEQLTCDVKPVQTPFEHKD